jgi:hypothetical protein
MRRKVLFLLFLMAFNIASVWAEELSKEQAQLLAEQFAAAHQNRKSPPDVTAAGQVNGLYVFNIANDGGFVIVSNDDATTPILGYGDHGNIDTDNLPDNMRAWLKGYADEIAWLKANGTPGAGGTKAPRRVGSHKTDDIAPLITTTWNQGTPYNNLCPEYEAGTHCVTGCVATAYAQVMYYTETVTHNNATTVTTADILGYTTRNGKHTLPTITAGATIDWSGMIASYNGDYTEEQADDVAYMMLVCGCAVQMNYDASSGAYTRDVTTALKGYFGYAETTRYVNRSCYTYANWTDLIYNELSQGRPVVYGGQGTDGGHAFVCDGYMYDDGDLFHINWGWGGMSDGYFVLSVLNPDEQGIGGSATSSAYNRGQEAVIGIQKVGDKGTVLDVPTTEPNSLTINSITLSHGTIALGESVNVTVNVTNNSTTNVYDGEIALSGIRGGGMFVIPAEGNMDCVITVTPTAAKSYTIKASYYTGTIPTETSTCSASLTVKDQTPTDLTASDIASESATIGWTNVGDAAAWNLRSMPVGVITEDFNGSMNGWRLNRSSKDDTQGIDGTPCIKYQLNEQNQWLISPKVNLGGSFSFYAWKSGETTEKFSVLYSKNGSLFYYIMRNVEATTTPTEYTVNLGDLSGEGWVAVLHAGGTEGSFLYVDDATIVEPAGDWTTVSALNTNSYSLTGLSATPRYQVQVQAVNNDGGKWSESYVFTTAKNTLQLANNGTDNANLIKLWNGITANVTLSGRTLYKDGAWNTLCLPFNVTISGSALDGADARALSASSFDSENSTLNITFTEPLSTIEAGKPYIIRWGGQAVGGGIGNNSGSVTNGYNTGSVGNQGTDIVNPVFTGVTVKNGTNDTKTDYLTFIGNYEPVEINGGDNTVLYLGAEDKLYYPSQNRTINAFRAYFQLSGITAGDPTSSPDPNAVRAFDLHFSDGTDCGSSGDDAGATSVNSEKLLGEQLITTTEWYTLDGRKITGIPTAKGIYVYKGRKAIIK